MITEKIIQNNRKSIRFDANGFSNFNSPAFPISHFNKWENVDVIVAMRVPMLIPKELYCAENQLEYLQLQYEISPDDTIIVEEFQDYYSLFYLTSDEKKKSVALNINPQYTHLLLYTYSHFDFSTKENYIITDIVNNQLALYLFKEKRIQTINQFNIKSLDDILYYILYLSGQNGLQQEEISLLFTKASEIEITFLQNYFPCINF